MASSFSFMVASDCTLAQLRRCLPLAVGSGSSSAPADRNFCSPFLMISRSRDGEDRNVVRPFPQGISTVSVPPQAVKRSSRVCPEAAMSAGGLVGGGRTRTTTVMGLSPNPVEGACRALAAAWPAWGGGLPTVEEKVPLWGQLNMPGLLLFGRAARKAPFSCSRTVLDSISDTGIGPALNGDEWSQLVCWPMSWMALGRQRFAGSGFAEDEGDGWCGRP